MRPMARLYAKKAASRSAAVKMTQGGLYFLAESANLLLQKCEERLKIDSESERLKTCGGGLRSPSYRAMENHIQRKGMNKMNQTQTRSPRKRLLSLILAVILMIGLLPISAFATSASAQAGEDKAATQDSEFLRIFHLDCGRKYFTVSEIEGIIDQLAENHFTHLQLAFGNDGLRFLLDDMSLTVNGTEYDSTAVTSAIKRGNTYLTSGSSGELSQSDMDAIIKYANTKGIQIIPLFNAPGHMYTAVNAMDTLGVGGKHIEISNLTDGRTSNWAVNPTDATAVAFAKALLQKYVTYFAGKGSTMFNIGADESGLDKDNYASYAKMVNDMNAIVKAAGMTTLAYNDGIYRAEFASSQPGVKFDNDIVICYWTEENSISVAEFLSKGFKILNNNGDWYYVLGDYLYRAWLSTQWSYQSALSNLQSTPVTKMMGYTGTEQPMGSILCVWCDGPSVGYTTGYGYREKNQTNQQSVYNLIKAMAENNPDYFTGKVKLSASDDATGVSVAVTGAKGQKATVEVKEITSGFTFDTEAHVSYNVTPTVDGKAYTGEGTVTLPVPEGWATEASRIHAYIIDNGAVKLISGTLSGGKYTFQVPHFSEMGLVQLAKGAGLTPGYVTVSEGGDKVITISGVNLAKAGVTFTTDDPSIATVTVTGQDAVESSVKYNKTSVSYSALAGSNTSWTKTQYFYKVDGNYYPVYAYCNVNWSIFGYYYNYYVGYSKDGGATKITVVDGERSDGTITVYKQSSTDAVPASSTITFHGVKAGAKTYANIGGVRYEITVTEKTIVSGNTIELPVSIVDYRADGLLFDYDVNDENPYSSYAYSLVRTYKSDSLSTGQNAIAGTTLEFPALAGHMKGNGTGSNYWNDRFPQFGGAIRTGLVQDTLGANGMPVYTDAAVKFVAERLAHGAIAAQRPNKDENRNDILYNTFLKSGADRSVLNSETSKFSTEFSTTKTYANIKNAYDLAWYLLNTIYEGDKNTASVTDNVKGGTYTLPIYGMATDVFNKMILRQSDDGTYYYLDCYVDDGQVVLDKENKAIYNGDSGYTDGTKFFYPLTGEGYDKYLGDTTDMQPQTTVDTENDWYPVGANGNFTLKGEAQFIYRNADNLYFTFSGDDDVYLFINNKLALDIGGSHWPVEKTVNLNELSAEYGLEEGQVATFTFFYMERCADASNFSIKTNIELAQRDINVEKKAYDTSYANEYASGTAVINGTTVAYDLIVTNKSNSPMSQIKLTDTDSLHSENGSENGKAELGYGVTPPSVKPSTLKDDRGTVALGQGNGYVLFITDSTGTEVANTRKSFSSLQDLSNEIAKLELPAGQSLHVRFLTATTKINDSKILDYINTVEVSATVGGQALSDTASHELYSYNANDTGRTYVVDFGLPLEITGIFDEGAAKNIGEVSLSPKNEQKYGTVTIAPSGFNTTLTYTRTADTTINEPETITLDVVYKIGNSKIKLEKTLTIIPASNVYYEDSLATFTNGTGAASDAKWSIVDKDGNETTEGTAPTQALEQLGSSGVYGYDKAYKDSSMLSMGTAHKVTVTANMANTDTWKAQSGSAWPTAQFTFKGTGFDIISLTNNKSGAIFVDVYKAGEEKPTYSYIVDNYYGYNYNKETGKWDVVNSGTENALYQIPVMKVTGLDYGEYNAVVTVFYDGLFNQTKDSQYSFWLDAVRIYDPMGEYADYTKDNEGYPQYIKLRDTLAKSTIGTTLFIDGKENATIAEYANYGPNNEVYLMKGQAITFKIPQNANVDSIQIGAKAPDGKPAQMVVNKDNPVEISTATEMYYKINVNVSAADQTVVIANKDGTGILSLTNLKITFKNKPTDKITLTALNNQEQENAVSLVRALFTAPVATFSPETFEADWGRAVRAGKRATLTVKTSADVESITVDGQAITSYTTRTQRTGWGWWSPKVTYHVFTYTITAPAQTTDYAVCAVNAEGTASEAVTATLTVKPTTWWNWWF